MSTLFAARALLALIVSLTLLGNGASAKALGGFQHNFSAKFLLKTRGTLIGKTEWTLISNNRDELIFESESKAAGIAVFITNDHIIERSWWKRQEQGFVPHNYKYDRSGGKKEKQVTVDFDWHQGVVRNTAKGGTWSMPVPEGTLDKLSYVLVMMHDLDNGRADLQYQIADGGKLKLYHFKSIGEEKLNTVFGKLSTVIIQRIRDHLLVCTSV